MSLLYKKIKIDQIYIYASYALIAYCVILRYYYYSYSKFFWQDEAWLFFSLYKNDFLNVFIQKNIFFQTYPSLFGIASWFVIECFGANVYALRFIPFLCSCLFFVLIYIVAKKILNSKYAMLCLAISSFNLILLNYCDEFKQYSLEADVSLVLLLYYLNNAKNTFISYKFVVISMFSILFSVPSPFIVLAISVCFFKNFLATCKNNKNLYIQTIAFFKDNALQIVVLTMFSLLYYYFCLRTGDANNGNAWKNGMIPLYHTEWIDWICNNFFVILSKLLSNSKDLLVGNILVVCALFGFLLLIKRRKSFSNFLKIFLFVFILSLCRFYSLGNIYWGIQGARLSMYILPIFILCAGFFVYYITNITYKIITKKYLTKNNKFLYFNKSIIPNICVVLFSVYLSFWTIVCINEWNYNFYKSYDDIVGLINKNEKHTLAAHSSMWYSVEFYNIYKKCDLNVKKLGNQKTPVSEYPPKSIDFTPGFVAMLNDLQKNEAIFVFIPEFLKDKIIRFIVMRGCTIEFFYFDNFYILKCEKIY